MSHHYDSSCQCGYEPHIRSDIPIQPVPSLLRDNIPLYGYAPAVRKPEQILHLQEPVDRLLCGYAPPQQKGCRSGFHRYHSNFLHDCAAGVLPYHRSACPSSASRHPYGHDPVLSILYKAPLSCCNSFLRGYGLPSPEAHRPRPVLHSRYHHGNAHLMCMSESAGCRYSFHCGYVFPIPEAHRPQSALHSRYPYAHVLPLRRPALFEHRCSFRCGYVPRTPPAYKPSSFPSSHRHRCEHGSLCRKEPTLPHGSRHYGYGLPSLPGDRSDLRPHCGTDPGADAQRSHPHRFRSPEAVPWGLHSTHPYACVLPFRKRKFAAW